jgi:Insulinase (Peptidase family M16)
MTNKWWLLGAALTLHTALFAQMNKINFTEYNLDNGLHVILHEDHATPIVAVSVLYHVGSKNENPERTGFAHFFEHLMFAAILINTLMAQVAQTTQTQRKTALFTTKYCLLINSDSACGSKASGCSTLP